MTIPERLDHLPRYLDPRVNWLGFAIIAGNVFHRIVHPAPR